MENNNIPKTSLDYARETTNPVVIFGMLERERGFRFSSCAMVGFITYENPKCGLVGRFSEFMTPEDISGRDYGELLASEMKETNPAHFEKTQKVLIEFSKHLEKKRDWASIMGIDKQ